MVKDKCETTKKFQYTVRYYERQGAPSDTLYLRRTNNDRERVEFFFYILGVFNYMVMDGSRVRFFWKYGSTKQISGLPELKCGHRGWL